MFKSTEEVPDAYRHMFYPPKVMDFKIEPDGDAGPWPEMFSHSKMLEEFNMMFFLGISGGDIPPVNPERSEDLKLLGRLKYAYIKEGEKRYITYVDNTTMKAYRLKDDSYYNGLLCPLEEVVNCTFDRWCRGMDL